MLSGFAAQMLPQNLCDHTLESEYVTAMQVNDYTFVIRYCTLFTAPQYNYLLIRLLLFVH
jgi:hypothetical protein